MATTKTKNSQSNLTKVTTWSGVPVFVDTNGTFYAKVDDIEIRQDRLDAVRTKIDAALKPSAKKVPISLPVIVIIEDEKMEITTITGLSRTNREIQFEPPLTSMLTSRHYARILADTPANRARAAAYIEAYKVKERAQAAVSKRQIEVSGYGRIDIGQYESIIAGLTAAHKKSGSS